MTLTEIQNRIRTKRDEIATEVRSYDAQTSVKNSWRADRQRMLDWLDGLLEAQNAETTG